MNTNFNSRSTLTSTIFLTKHYSKKLPFVADEHDNHITITMLTRIFEPSCQVVECISSVNASNEHNISLPPGYVFTGACLSTAGSLHWGGGSASGGGEFYIRPPQHWILWDMVNDQAVRILLECMHSRLFGYRQ